MNPSHNSPSFRFTLRGLMLLTGGFACFLALLRWTDLIVVIVLAVLPFCVLIERFLGGTPRPQPVQRLGWYIFSHIRLILFACLPAVTAWISIQAGVPNLMSPFPFLVVLPRFMELGPGLVSLAFLVSFVLFHLYLGRAVLPQPIPLRFPILLGITSALSVPWFWFGWGYGLQYQGAHFVWGMGAINLVLVAALWSLWWVGRSRATPLQLLGLAALLHFWLSWCALPYLGELP